MNNNRILISEFNSRMYAAKVRINDLENNSVRNIQSNAHRKEKRRENTEKCIKLYIGYVKKSNVHFQSCKRRKENELEAMPGDTD